MAAPHHPYALLLQTFAERANPLRVEERLAQVLRQCQQAQLDELPLPGSGRTLARWQALAQVAGFDLALVKLFEGHTDGRAILAELGATHLDNGGLWAVWAAEAPGARLQIAERQGSRLKLAGRKAWCSGALQVDHALATAWDEQGRPQLVAISMADPGIRPTEQGWQAVGMAASASVEVDMDGAYAQAVGGPGEYLSRPGFWQGGAGIAACWYGAAVCAGDYLREYAQRSDEPHRLAHLGAVDAHLSAAAAVLRETAAWIDAHPAADAERVTRRARAVVEEAVEGVLKHVGRALGASPFCRDARFARLFADLPVFMRQSHAERDLAALGASITDLPSLRWAL